MDSLDSSCLDAIGQLEYMRDKKGISFNLMSEEAALLYLTKQSYFYKVKSFAKNFEKYETKESQKGVYINLDFGHLVLLEQMDNLFREAILRLTLDIEHALKTRINDSAMKCGANPTLLTDSFLNVSYKTTLDEQVSKYDADNAVEAIADIKSRLDKIDSSQPLETIECLNAILNRVEGITRHRDPAYVAKSITGLSSSNYSGGIVRKHEGSVMPYWCVLELVSFGPLASFYKQCFKKEGLIEDDIEASVCKDIKNMLRQVQVLRNAAAHGDALLNTLSKHNSSSSLKGIRRKMKERGIENECASQVASVPVALEFTSVLMCYEILVLDSNRCQEAANTLLSLAETMKANSHLFKKCYSVTSFLSYMDFILQRYSKRFTDGDQTLKALSSNLILAP